MQFKCSKCGKIVVRDARCREVRRHITKSGRYKSYCDAHGAYAFLRPVNRRGLRE